MAATVSLTLMLVVSMTGTLVPAHSALLAWNRLPFDTYSRAAATVTLRATSYCRAVVSASIPAMRVGVHLFLAAARRWQLIVICGAVEANSRICQHKLVV
jgi:hypothetical protein